MKKKNNLQKTNYTKPRTVNNYLLEVFNSDVLT